MESEDIEDSIIRITESGCWIWMGYIQGNGYGRANGTTAHRFVYSELIGEIPEGKQLDHLCRVRCCVNPYHLEPVTQRENILRGTAPQAINARKTHCPQGHEYTPENTKLTVRGHRICRICDKKRKLNSYHRNRDEILKRRAIYRAIKKEQ